MAKRVAEKTAIGIDAGGKPRQHSLVWLQGLLCGAMVTLATPTALLLGVLLCPAVLALVLDRQPGRPKARGVALFNMAAAVDPLRTLWMSGHSMSNASALLGDMRILGTAWSAAARRRRLAAGGAGADRGSRRAGRAQRCARRAATCRANAPGAGMGIGADGRRSVIGDRRLSP
jgi:hypothetical protein